MSATQTAPRATGRRADPLRWPARPAAPGVPGRATLLVAIVIGYLIWSLAPVLIAFLFSFNSGYSRSIWQGFSLQWWTGPQSVFHQPMYYDAIRPQLPACRPGGDHHRAAGHVAVDLPQSLARGLRQAGDLPLDGAARRTRVVLALSMFFLVTKLLHFVALGTVAQVAGQVTFILPLVIVITRGRLSSIPIGFEEAAMDLGATPMQAFRYALIPLLQPAILASAIVAFAVSVDDFVITQYMSSNVVDPIGADADLHRDSRDRDAGAQRDGDGDGRFRPS